MFPILKFLFVSHWSRSRNVNTSFVKSEGCANIRNFILEALLIFMSFLVETLLVLSVEGKYTFNRRLIFSSFWLGFASSEPTNLITFCVVENVHG